MPSNPSDMEARVSHIDPRIPSGLSPHRERVRWRRSIRRVLRLRVLLPAAVAAIIVIFLLAPIVTVILASFTASDYIAFPPELPFSLHWYQEFARDPVYRSSLANSILVASIMAVVAVVIGTLGAVGLTRRSFRREGALYFALFLPFLVPGIVLGVGLSVSLGPLGIEAIRGSYAVLVVAHLLWATPLVFVVMVSVLRDAGTDLEAAAMVLGASPVRVLREVTLPLVRSGLAASLILAFVISLHEFIMALFLVGPDTTTLPVVVWNSLKYEARPIIAAIDSVMVGSVVVALIAMAKLVGLDKLTVR